MYDTRQRLALGHERNTTGTVKAAGDLVTTRGKADKRRDKEQVIEEDQDGDLWSSYYSLYTDKTGFKAQYESYTRVRTLIHLLLVMSNPRIGILGWRATDLVHDVIITSS